MEEERNASVGSDVGDVGPAPNADSELSLQTIVDQQRIINAMREIITTLKTRVATLEAVVANSPPPGATAGTTTASSTNAVSAAVDAAHEEAISRLTRLVEQRTTERDAAVGRCAELESALKDRGTQLTEALMRCRRLQQMEEECRTTRSLTNLAETRCRERMLQCETLEGELEASLFERARWKALATSITNRLDPVTRERALLHIGALERDERTRMRMAAHSALPTQRMSMNTAVSETKHASTPDALELMDVWNTRCMPSQRQSLPRGNIDAGRAQLTGNDRGGTIMRRRANRYLVPL